MMAPHPIYHHCSIKEIRAGINAFTLIEKDRKETNIPLKEDVILRAFRLINKTASDVLVRKWIKKNRPYLECEKKERKEFEKYVSKVEKDLKAEKQMTYPDDKDSTDRLFIHEFLFLLCNSKPRNDMINKLPKPEWTTERKSIKQYDMQALDALRLDRLFKIELKDIGKFAKQNGGSHEPLIVMQKVLNSEVMNKNFRFEGIKIMEIVNTNN